MIAQKRKNRHSRY